VFFTERGKSAAQRAIGPLPPVFNCRTFASSNKLITTFKNITT
jgi:hypothetical protein